ncbi:hypothetical protein ACFLZ1_02755 [Patescibacteria group bacterium]
MDIPTLATDLHANIPMKDLVLTLGARIIESASLPKEGDFPDNFPQLGTPALLNAIKERIVGSPENQVLNTEATILQAIERVVNAGGKIDASISKSLLHIFKNMGTLSKKA